MKGDGKICTNTGKDELDGRCGVHKGKAAPAGAVPNTSSTTAKCKACGYPKGDGKPCHYPGIYNGRCGVHQDKPAQAASKIAGNGGPATAHSSTGKSSSKGTGKSVVCSTASSSKVSLLPAKVSYCRCRVLGCKRPVAFDIMMQPLSLTICRISVNHLAVCDPRILSRQSHWRTSRPQLTHISVGSQNAKTSQRLHR